MTRRRFGDATLECVRGNIVEQPDMDAVVNAANAALRTGGGVAGAIHRAAGPELDAACRPLAPIEPGQAVITPAFALPNRYVIHCLGPVYGRDESAADLLESCYRSALRLAERERLRSVAFPAISTGSFGYPLEEAAEIAMRAVRDELGRLRCIKHVRFVLFGAADEAAHARALAALPD